MSCNTVCYINGLRIVLTAGIIGIDRCMSSLLPNLDFTDDKSCIY